MLLAGRDQNGVPGFDSLLTVLITNLALPFNQPLFKAVLFTKDSISSKLTLQNARCSFTATTVNLAQRRLLFFSLQNVQEPSVSQSIETPHEIS